VQQQKLKRKACLSATLSTTKTSVATLGLDWGLQETPATNCLSYNRVMQTSKLGPQNLKSSISELP